MSIFIQNFYSLTSIVCFLQIFTFQTTIYYTVPMTESISYWSFVSLFAPLQYRLCAPTNTCLVKRWA